MTDNSQTAKTTPARQLLNKITDLVQSDPGSCWWMNEDKALEEINKAFLDQRAEGYADARGI